MQNDYLFQGGNYSGLTPFFYEIINFIQEHYDANFSIMDLGSGVLFEFEKKIFDLFSIHEEKGKNIQMYCIDRTNPYDSDFIVPDFVNFTCCSIEQLIKSDRKFDIVYFSELIEHIDFTDILLQNCFNLLKHDGFLICTVPNLSSLYSRLELLFGFQPHILEVSNENPYLGTGFFGKINNTSSIPLHHIRGITYKAMKELLYMHGFDILITKGHNGRPFQFIRSPSYASDVLYICKKRNMNK